MRVVMILVVVLGSLSVGQAYAQPEPVEVQPGPPPPYPPQPYAPQPQPPPPSPQPYYVAPGAPCPPGMTPTDRGCLSLGVEGDPAYQAAKSRRTTGIVLAATLPSVGAVTIAVAAFVALARSLGSCDVYYNYSCSSTRSYTSEKIAIGVGTGMIIVGLAVGIPLAVSGSRQMREIRSHYGMQMPRASLDVGPDRAVLVTSWAF